MTMKIIVGGTNESSFALLGKNTRISRLFDYDDGWNYSHWRVSGYVVCSLN